MIKVLSLFTIALLPAALMVILPGSITRIMGFNILPGIPLYEISYLIFIYFVIATAMGARFLMISIALSVVASAPMILAGSALSCVLSLFTGPDAKICSDGPHYVGLLLNILSTVAIAVTLVCLSLRPLRDYERRLTLTSSGVSVVQRKMLLACRVIVHIFFFVVPVILEVIREERILRRFSFSMSDIKAGCLLLVRIVYQGTCETLQFIPLWAGEIESLPATRVKT
jgi:uncharacterized membrane protein YhaH (DUF805 family)